MFRNALLVTVAAVSSAAYAGRYGPFGPDEDYVIALDACEMTMDLRQIHPPLGTVDFSRSSDAARLRITMASSSRS